MYAKRGDFDRAEGWMKRMPEMELQPDETTYNAMIDGFARVGDVANAEAWFTSLSDTGMSPNIFSYSSVIHACAMGEDRERAEQWLGKLSEAAARTSTAVTVTSRSYLDALLPNVICYNSVIHACAIEGNVERAKHWLQEMKANGVQPTVHSFSTIINLLTRSGELHAATVWLKLLRDSGLELDIMCYNMLFRAYGASNYEYAEALFKYMCESGVQPNVVTLNLILNAYAEKGLPEECMWWVGKMRQRGVQPDQVTINTITKALETSTDVAIAEVLRAEHWLKAAREARLEVMRATYGSLVSALRRMGRERDANDLASQMDSQEILRKKITTSRAYCW